MELQIAIQRATQILYEERIRPTVRYADAAFAYLEDSRKLNADVQSGVITRAESIAITTGRPRRLNIVGMRNQDPRTVSESQHGFTFSSLNYDLLLKLFNLVNQSERDVFVASLVSVIPTQGEFCARADEYAFPSLDGFVCEFPLIAEFAIRAGYSKDLFTAMNKATVPTYGMAVLLIHLEDMLSLNFTLFSESELERMALWLSPLRNMADLQTYSARGKHGIGGMAPNPLYKAGREKQGSQIVKSIDSMYGLISQALFFISRALSNNHRISKLRTTRRRLKAFWKVSDSMRC